MGEKLSLPDVTLITVSSANLENTQCALLSSSEHIDFGAIKMLSHVPPHTQYPHIQYVKIPNINFAGYSRIMLEELYRYVDTSHCLVVQSDGFVINPQNWSDEFLAYDYIGAPWDVAIILYDGPPNSVLHLDRNRVGNGGFSLRSKKLLEVTAGLKYDELYFYPNNEDLIICHFLYERMMTSGIKFAPPELAARFSIESPEQLYGQTLQTVFGFHGKHWLEAVNQQDLLRDFQGALEPVKHLPRYAPATVHFLNNEFHIVDVATFASGFEEIFLRKNYDFNAGTENPYIIDCGANIGMATLFFKRKYPEARIHAYEPDPKIFEALSKNIKSFNLDNVVLHREAVWSDNTLLQFRCEGGFSGRIPKPGDTGSIIQVKAKRLRDLLTEPVEFLKLDVEGAETTILRDCADLLKNVKHLFCEYHSHASEKQTLEEILTILSEAGFRYHIKEAFTSPNPFIHRPYLLGMDLQLDVFAFRT